MHVNIYKHIIVYAIGAHKNVKGLPVHGSCL